MAASPVRDSPPARPSESGPPEADAGGSCTASTPPRHAARRQLRIAARALGSLLLGGAAILGPIVVFRQGVLPLVDALFEPGPAALSAIRRAGILLAAIVGYVAYLRWHEKRRPTELRLRPVPLLLGGAGGALLVAIPIALLFALGAYELVATRPLSPALPAIAVLIGIAATLEEVLYRCLLFRVLERAWGTTVAMALQAVVFAVGHLENLENGPSGEVVVMLLSVALVGLLWAGVFVLTRNLWATAAHHAAWNFTILLSGVPLSGIEDWRALAPLETRYAGPDWLTGGLFGPESSLLVMATTTAAVALLLRAGRQRRAFRGA
jgi:hypothetical protein